MAKSGGKVIAAVRDAISGKVAELGFSIWDVEFRKIGADFHLIITIDRDAGVDIDDCERVHRAIDPLLDEADPIEESYYLDVSSPGLERDIRTKEHFLALTGQKAKIKTFAPVNGKKEFIGTLSCNEDASVITVTTEKEAVKLEFTSIAKANLYCEF